jgi:dCMP deaminase
VRPDREAWHLDGADWLARMGDCTRRQVGALVIGTDKRIWGAGYNGSFPGGPSCLEGACPRGRHYERKTEALDYPGPPVCACGKWWPCPDAVAPGSSYDTGPGACISTHAEGNAKADAQIKGYSTLPDAVMYVSCEPCEGCVRDLRNTTQLAAIRWRDGVIGLP